ncbi:pilus assembly protein TadG-related protein [Phreatobacter sp.]|uniref:pilus assembly protein TadG-related protein n=1 Tax=Phreatobacter sp. TaxID=1966341 RepID=UPI003F708C18
MAVTLGQFARMFARDRQGNVAITFAISLVPVLGLAGGAVDLHQRSRDTAALQGVFDAAAIAGARQSALGPVAVQLATERHLAAHISGHLATYPVQVQVTDAGRRVRVATTDAKMKTSFLGVIGMTTLNLNVRATAESHTFRTVTSAKPVVAELDPEAGDYNRMYVYCYDRSRANQPDQGRSQMTAIADNAGTKYEFNMPVCKEGETISYRLYNVRNARTKPALWDNNQPGTLVPNNAADWADPWANNKSYNYYSDTTMVGGVMNHNFSGGVPILETVLCNNLAQCKTNSKGGVIPEGRSRNPQQANRACEPGKFMYFGWEDRPPGYGWTDSDYDDIRVIVECPKISAQTSTVVRLTE